MSVGPLQHPFVGQSPPDHVVDLRAERMGRRQQQGAPARVGIEGEPQVGHGPGEFRVRVRAAADLQDARAQFRDRERRALRDQVLDRGPQRRVALAQHLGHARGGHAGALEQPERLAGLDRPELRAVADQDHAGHADPGRDPEQPDHRDRADHGRLVDDQEATAVHRPGFRQPGLVRRVVGDVAVADQKPLQGAGRDPRFASEHQGRVRRRREPEQRGARGEARHLPQHRRLAGAGVALHPDHRGAVPAAPFAPRHVVRR